MRKILISCNRANATAATAVTLLMALCLTASCCHHGKAIDPDDDIPISMSVSSTGTKAIVNDLDGMIGQCFDNQDQYIPDTGFGVYGYKKENSGKSIKIIDNFLIQPSNNSANTTWTYTPKRYWDSDPNVSYQFIAYWPHLVASGSGPYVSVPGPDNGDYTDERKVLTIHNVPNWKFVDGTEVDYMTAVASGKYRTSVQYEVPAFYNGTVHLSFRHILSQLVIKACYIGSEFESNSGPGVKVNSIKLTKSDTNEQVLSNTSSGDIVDVTDFSQKYSDNDAAPLTPASPKTNMADECILDLPEATGVRIPYMDEHTKVFTLGTTNPTGPQVVGRWLMVPHKWQNLNLSVNRKIGDADYAYSVPVPVTAGESNYDYVTQPGSTYIITLMIDVATGGITLAPIEIQNWIGQNTTHEVYNW